MAHTGSLISCVIGDIVRGACTGGSAAPAINAVSGRERGFAAWAHYGQPYANHITRGGRGREGV
jgi:hypothetical protein